MDIILLFSIIFIVISLVGFLLAYLYGRKTTNFRWSEYLAIIIAPLLFIVFLGIYFDKKILLVFSASAVVGFIAEGIVGFVYEKVIGQRLWTYNYLSVKGHTSILSIPI
jgi:MFS-type transporter involved in bile tolerance (Atg22 family)